MWLSVRSGRTGYEMSRGWGEEVLVRRLALVASQSLTARLENAIGTVGF